MKEPYKHFPIGDLRDRAKLCSEPNCQAYKIQDSPGGFCQAHSLRYQEKREEFHGNIIEAMEDENYFGSVFGTDQSSWSNWKVVLKAIFNIQMEPEEIEIYKQLTNRETVPKKQPREVFLVMGRRSGKSVVASFCAVWLAFFRDYKKYLQKGERGYITIIASDRSQTQILMGYIKALLSLPAFEKHVEKTLREQIDLDNGISIIVKTASVSSPRGLTNIAVIGDEVSFWKGENSVNNDVEIYGSLVPTGLSIPGFLMFFISTPYARSGLLYEKYQKYFGVKDKHTLVCQAPSQLMNKTLPSQVIEDELLRDPDGARAEYLAVFREDISGWLSYQVIENAIIRGRGNQPQNPKFKYFGFCDGSSGSGSDAFTIAIGHAEKNISVIDFVMEWRVPFSPKQIIEQCAKHLKSYGLRQVTGDKFSIGLMQEEFRKNGITYEYSELSVSEIYRESAYSFNEGSIELPDNKRLEGQLKSLEKRTRRGGRDSISHPPFKNSHDDISNSVCGVIVNLKMGVHTDLDSMPLPSLIDSQPEKPSLSKAMRQEEDEFVRAVKGGGVVKGGTLY